MVDHLSYSADPSLRLQVRQEMLSCLPPSRVVLETCDRVELYRGEGPWDAGTLLHLSRVATGLESPLPGEKAVLGQVRSAIEDARQDRTCSSSLDRLFQVAVSIARKVRTKTAIDTGSIGHGQALTTLLESIGRPLAGELVLVIGANDLTRSIIRWLSKRHACSFILANRQYDKACALAGEFRIGAIPLADLPLYIDKASIVISATAAPHLIVHRRWLDGPLPPLLAGNEEVLERLFYDLAVPPDIDPAIAAIEGCSLMSIRDLEASMAQTLGKRTGAMTEASRMVEAEVERAMSLHRSRYCA